MLAVKGDRVVDELVELLAGWGSGSEEFAHLSHKIIAASRQHPDEERFLVVEEAVERAGGELCPLGDLLQRGFVVALQPEDVFGCVEDVPTAELLTAMTPSFPRACFSD